MQPESLRQNQNWERSDQPYTQVQKHIQKIGVQNETITVESLAGRCAPSSDSVSDRLWSTLN
jgi:phage protein U